jgi:hypothetical protein
MERRRLQQQKMKQQQRFCVSQQDLTQTISRMKPQRRATHNNLMNLSSLSLTSSCSNETLTIPSVSQLVKEFEARAVSTPYVSAQDVLPNNNVIFSNGAESNCVPQMSVQTMNIKVNDNNDQFTGDKEQIHQTLDNDRHKRDLPSSYYSTESNNNTTQNMDINLKRHDKRFNDIRTKEAQLNNALADLISLSNDADISSSISSSSRSLTNNFQRQRTSSANDNSNSISASIALLNNLLETFDLDNEDHKNKKTNIDQTTSSKNEDIKPINMFW